MEAGADAPLPSSGTAGAMDPQGDTPHEFVPDGDVGSGPSGAPPLRYSAVTDGDILNGLASRHDLLVADAESMQRHRRVIDNIAARNAVLFMPTDIQEGICYDSGKQCYQLIAHGVTPDGMKSQVVLQDVPVFFDVWVPLEMADTETGNGQFFLMVSTMLREHGLTKVEQGDAFPLRGYSTKARKYLRIHFRDLKSRKGAIQVVRDSKYETANDDRTNYFRMVARTFALPLSSWWLLKDYTYEQGGARCSCTGADGTASLAMYPVRNGAPLAVNSFRVKIGNVRAVVHPLRPSKAAEEFISSRPALARDPSVIMTLDIETHSPDKGLGTPPAPHKPNDVVFMICCTLHRYRDSKPLAQVCLTTQECAPDSRWTTVICGSGGSPLNSSRPNHTYGQDSLLMALALVWRAWAPDMYVGFNNGQYDDPFIVEKARQFGMLTRMDSLMSASPRKKNTDEAILRFNYRDRNIKVSAERSHKVDYWKIDGCVPLDARVAFMRLYPKAEKSSLRYFLDMVKLGGKADMPYTRMWSIYERAVRAADSALDGGPAPDLDVAEHMRQVAHYCIVDALRCQEMILKKNIISEYREVGNYSFTSLFDCIYYAGGHKVCNMLLAYGQMSADLLGAPILGSMIAEHVEMSGKYPGAFVVPPEKGLEEDLPITGLDFASLYPSLIRAYNLSPDRAIFSEEEALRLEAEGKSIHRVEFPFGGDIVRGWFVRHDGVDCERGIFARALADLFNMRAEMKKDVKWLEALIEWMEAALGDFENMGADGARPPFFGHIMQCVSGLRDEVSSLKADPDGVKKAKLMQKVLDELSPIIDRCRAEQARLARDGGTLQPEFFEDELDKVEFTFSGINSKQKAVKVFMNTFYGEAGNSRSPIFMLPLAGGVTSAGRYNLKLVAQFVEDKGFLIKYGDTDSLYLACPPGCYAAITDEYNAAVRALGIVIPGDGEAAAGLMAAWNAKDKAIRDSAANLEEWKQTQMMTIDSRSPHAVGSPEFIADAELAESYRNILSVCQSVDAQICASQQALGPAPAGADMPAGAADCWLRDQLQAIRDDPAMGGPERADEMRRAIDAAYYKLCVEKINITMARMTTIRDEVNAHLAADNGTGILNMAYEEALYPAVFTGKKKYFGIPHVNKPNFNITSASKIFIRGIDVVKQGQTRLAKEVGYRCMWAATRLCPPGDRVPLIQRVENVISKSCSGMDSFLAGGGASTTGVGESAWSVSDFIQTDAWKPDKNNISVQTFMRRMRPRHTAQLRENAARVRAGEQPTELDYIEPEAGSRFSYLIVDSGPTFSLKGYVKSKNSKGDLMEYVHVAEKRRMRVNVPYYLIHYVVGLCARFINYDDRFQPPGASYMDSKAIDKFAQARAKTYLTRFVRSLSAEDVDIARSRGAAYKRAFKRAAQRTCDILSCKLGRCSDMFTGADRLIINKADGELTPQERADRGIVNFELFLPQSPGEDEADPQDGDESPVPVAPTLSLGERLCAAAQRVGERVADASEQAVPAVRLQFSNGSDGPIITGHHELHAPMGLCESITKRLDIDRTPLGRRNLYDMLEAVQQPTRRMMRRRVPPPAVLADNAISHLEREALDKINEAADVIEGYSERVRDRLYEQVLMERDQEHRARPAELGVTDCERSAAIPPVISGGSAGELDDSSLECTPGELAAISRVRDGWQQLLGVAAVRATRRRLVRHMTEMRDRSL
jgi:DNA polymerase elongation subunit (family B)